MSTTFTKRAEPGLPGILDFESAGLQALRQAGARVPTVIAQTGDELTLERVPGGGRASSEKQEQFGRELAALHRTTGDRYGAVAPGVPAYLGLCPIDLTPTTSWSESILQRRVLPLTYEAIEGGSLDPRAAALAEQLQDRHLGPTEPPTLVHGDLWAGNRMVDERGDSWLIDPSAHYGHREEDLAMMHMFGGFTDREIAAYNEAFPLAPGWRERIGVYQLVPLLVHAILFGGGYGSQTMRVLTQATR